MEIIKGIVINILVIIFLTTIMDMMLPEGSLQPFVKMIMGLFIIVAILSPIIELFYKDSLIASLNLKPFFTESNQESIMAQGQQYQTAIAGNMMTEYEVKLNQQIESLLLLLEEIEACDVETSIIYQENLAVLGKLQSVDIWVVVSHDDVEKTIERVKKMVAGYYGISQDEVQVYVNQEQEEKVNE